MSVAAEGPRMEKLRANLSQQGLTLEEYASTRGPERLPLVAPKEEPQLVEVLRRAHELGVRVLPIGLGGRTSWCRPEVFDAREPETLALSTRKLRGVIAYEPGDGTLTAQAGCRMDALAEVVAAGGHRLTPDVPKPHRATLGGVVLAGESGLDRVRFGPTRHHVLGMRYLAGDGRSIQSGGRLVKNVTGFDLHRLLCGSRGTLGLALEISLRLFPLPDFECLLGVGGSSPRELFELAQRITRLEVSPDLLVLREESARSTADAPRLSWRLWIAYSGQPQLAQAAAETLEGLAGMPTLELTKFAGGEARARRYALRDAGAAPGQWPSFRASCLPSRVGDAFDTIATFAQTCGWTPTLGACPAIATIDATLDRASLADEAQLSAALGELRAQLSAAEVRLEPMDLPLAVCSALAPDGTGLDRRWMSQLARELDPGGRFASSHFPARSQAAQVTA